MPRAHFLSTLLAHPSLKSLFPFVATCYLLPSTCFYGELFLYSSDEGTAQGCPFGSFCFAVGLIAPLREVARKFGSVLILAYCDDIWLVGPPQATVEALNDLNLRLQELCTLGGCLEFCFSKGKT